MKDWHDVKTVHGGDIYSAKALLKTEHILDFSANINPFGIPLSVRTAIQNAIPDIVSYPDPYQRQLRKSIAAFHQIPDTYIICGNGAADVLFRTVQTMQPKHALLPVPTFTEYEKALTEQHTRITHWHMPAFHITDTLLTELQTKNYDFLVLCNPNNPTGICIDSHIVLKILQMAKQHHVFVLLDECFYDMTGYSDSMLSYIQHFPNLLILKSMTKFYALAGLRLGYGISSDKNLISAVQHTGQPWSVNRLASAAGYAALQDTAYQKQFLDFLIPERDFLYHALQKLNLKVWQPHANYIFFQAEHMHHLDKQLLYAYQILIRHCDSYPTLDSSYYRVAVRSHAENLYLLDCLQNIIHSA